MCFNHKSFVSLFLSDMTQKEKNTNQGHTSCLKCCPFVVKKNCAVFFIIEVDEVGVDFSSTS